jgi:hypothetical protein
VNTKIVKNTELDRARWDEFVNQSPDGNIFNLSWYLDAVFPEWEALIVQDGNDWIFLHPLFPKTKWGLKLSLQPLLVRYSGVATAPEKIEVKGLQDVLSETFSFFRLCKFSTTSQIFDSHYSDKQTYKLDISRDFDKIKAGYKSALRNKLSNYIQTDFEIIEDTSATNLVALLDQYIRSGKFRVPADYCDKLSCVFDLAHARGMAKIVIARNTALQVVASVLFFFFKDKMYILVSLVDEAYRKKALIPYLITEEIKRNSGLFKELDFLGSMQPGVAKFNQSFGAISTTYYEIAFKRFPFNIIPL